MGSDAREQSPFITRQLSIAYIIAHFILKLTLTFIIFIETNRFFSPLSVYYYIVHKK